MGALQAPLPNEKNLRLRARRGLTIYFAVLVPLTAIFEALIIRGRPSLVLALMWTPTAASLVARLLLREGFTDVSFRLGGARGAKAIGVAVIFPAALGLIAYGAAWASGLVDFRPEPIRLIASYVPGGTSPVLVFVANLVIAASVITLFSARTAAGEEIGWRGYMLTRLIDAGVPCPVLVSGVIWGLWHVPLILGGVYLAGTPPAISALLFMIMATAFSFVFARLRLATGSVWPAIALHSAWNAVIQEAFDTASVGPGVTLLIGESGILVAIAMLVAAIIFWSGQWPFRRASETATEIEPSVTRDTSAGPALSRTGK